MSQLMTPSEMASCKDGLKSLLENYTPGQITDCLHALRAESGKRRGEGGERRAESKKTDLGPPPSPLPPPPSAPRTPQTEHR